MAGEIGHATVDKNGRKCRCGNSGCLESMASLPAIIRRGEKFLDDDWFAGRGQLTFENLIILATRDHPRVVQLLAQTGFYLGIGIAIRLISASVLSSGGDRPVVSHSDP